MKEAIIIINGHTLTDGESMTVRVALQSLAMDLLANGLGKDAVGQRINVGYQEAIYSILRQMGLPGLTPNPT